MGLPLWLASPFTLHGPIFRRLFLQRSGALTRNISILLVTTTTASFSFAAVVSGRHIPMMFSPGFSFFVGWHAFRGAGGGCQRVSRLGGMMLWLFVRWGPTLCWSLSGCGMTSLQEGNGDDALASIAGF